jgi:hypothetical protein
MVCGLGPRIDAARVAPERAGPQQPAAWSCLAALSIGAMTGSKSERQITALIERARFRAAIWFLGP